MSTKKLNKFDTFREAFTYAFRRRDHTQAYYYKQIPMDRGQFSKYLGYKDEEDDGDKVDNPQAPTRKKLTDVVGIEIKKKGNKWILDDPLDSDYHDLKNEFENRSKDPEYDLSLSGKTRDRVLLNLLNDVESLAAKIRHLIELELNDDD